MSVLQKVKVNDVDIPEGVTKYDLYKVLLKDERLWCIIAAAVIVASIASIALAGGGIVLLSLELFRL